jgi:outer membrane protein TolC
MKLRNKIHLSVNGALAFTLTIAGTTSARGQSPAAVPAPSGQAINLNLGQTVQESLRVSFDVEQANRNAALSAQRVNETVAGSRPSIVGTASASRFDAATRIPFGSGQPVEVLPDHLETATLTAAYRLDFLGQVRAATDQARLQALADRILVNQVSNVRALNAKTSYYATLRADHQVQVAEAALRNAQVQRDTAKKLYEGQVGQKIDLLRAETQVATAQQDLTRAQNERDISRAAFNELLHRPLTAPFTLQDVSGVAIGADIGGKGDNAVGAENAPLFAAPVAEVTAINMDASIATALRQRPEILAAEAQLRATERGIKLARAGQEPTFDLSASGNYYPTFSLQTPRNKTAEVRIAARFPFYDGGVTEARVQQAKLRVANAGTSLESARSAVSLEVRQAYLNLSTAARQIDAANAALRQAVAARELAQVRYEGQVGLFLEVTDAQAALVRAENQQVDTVYNYFIARAQFDKALGVPQTASAP